MQHPTGKNLYQFYLLVVFITLVIPKAGDKVAGVPLTAASIFYALLLLMAVPILVKRKYPAVDLVYVLYISLVLMPWLIAGPGLGAFARVVLPIFVPLVIFYWLNPITQDFINSEDRLYQLVKIIAFANIIVALYGLAQKIFGHYQTIIPGITMSYTDALNPDIFYLKSNQIGESYKVTSTYQNGNILGTSLVMTALPLLAAFLYAREKRNKILFGVASVLSFAIIPLTMSRAAFFGALAGTGIFFLLQRSNRIRIPVAVIVLVVFAVILTSPMLRDRVIGEFFDPTMNGRTKVMRDFVAKANITPTSGIFGLYFNPQGPRIDGQTENIFNYSSENMYLTVAVWTGIIGLTLFLAVVMPAVLKMIRKVRAHPPESFASGLLTGVFAGAAGYLIQAFIEGAFHVLPTGFVFWLIIGMGNVLTRDKMDFQVSKR